MHDVPQIILQQLGGTKFLRMTGASQLVGSETMLMFALPRTRHFAKEGINKVRITLDPSDTYTMEYFKMKKYSNRIEEVIIHIESDVYAEDLQRFFTRATGLATSL